MKLLLFLVILWTSFGSLACSCQDPGSVEESLEYSDIVVHGKVISMSDVSYRSTLSKEHGDSLNDALEDRRREVFNSDMIVKVELEVKQIYKGEVCSDTLVIYTARSSSACGFRFKERENYIIYGMSESYQAGFYHDQSPPKTTNVFWTNHCTRTAEYTFQEAKELEALIPNSH